MVAFADVHGAYDELVALLRSQGLVDGSLRWSGADTQLVSLGDLLDRGPDSRRVLDLLMRLEGEARTAGGAVHVLLGNHEVMNIVGDLRYVSAGEYAAFVGRGGRGAARGGLAAAARARSRLRIARPSTRAIPPASSHAARLSCRRAATAPGSCHGPSSSS